MVTATKTQTHFECILADQVHPVLIEKVYIMNVSYVTTGEVSTITDKDNTVIGFYVGRKDREPIRLMNVIPEFYEPGHRFMIDNYGSYWVKK